MKQLIKMAKKLTRICDYSFDSSEHVCTYASACNVAFQQFALLGSSGGVIEMHYSSTSSKSSKFATDQKGEISAIEILKERQAFVAGNARGSIFLFDMLAQRQIDSFVRHSASILALQALGKNNFVSASLDTTVRLWDDRQKTEAITFKGHTGAVLAVNISPDDQWIASSSEDGTLRIWDIAANKLLLSFTESEQKSVCCLAFNPEEIQLAAGGVARKPVFYDLEKFVESGSVSLAPSTITSMSFDSTGSFLYVAGAGFMRSINAKKLSEWSTIEASWKIPQKLFFNEDGEVFGLGRNSTGASLYKITNISRKEGIEASVALTELEEILNTRKSHSKIAEILEKKIGDLSLLINVWLNQQNQRAAYSLIEKISDPKVVTDIFNMMLSNGMVPNLSVEFATLFLKKIYLILEVKYKFFIKLGLEFSIEVLRSFGPEIKSGKSFSVMKKVDLTREDRMRTYDNLLNELKAITKNHIFSKLRIQYKNEEIGQLANNYVAELDALIYYLNSNSS